MSNANSWSRRSRRVLLQVVKGTASRGWSALQNLRPGRVTKFKECKVASFYVLLSRYVHGWGFNARKVVGSEAWGGKKHFKNKSVRRNKTFGGMALLSSFEERRICALGLSELRVEKQQRPEQVPTPLVHKEKMECLGAISP